MYVVKIRNINKDFGVLRNIKIYISCFVSVLMYCVAAIHFWKIKNCYKNAREGDCSGLLSPPPLHSPSPCHLFSSVDGGAGFPNVRVMATH